MASTPDPPQQPQRSGSGGQRSHGHHRRRHHHRSRSQQDSRHLDFNQAMSDFKHMFPSMDSEVIEAVLRANNGTVDATIDQLLTMSVDFGTDDTDGVDRSTSTQPSALSSPSTPPPPFDASFGSGAPTPFDTSFGSGAPPPYESPESSSSSDDEDPITESLRTMRIREVPKPAPVQTQVPITSKAAFRHWNPPMIGKLPDDFLRISVPAQSPRNAASPRLRTTVSPVPRTPVPPISQKTPLRTTITPPTEGMNSIREINKTRRLLKERIAVNAKQRQEAPNHFDAETARFLEDERLALVLQNQEFLDELKRNAEFMDTLEKDVKDERNISVLPEDQTRKMDDRPEQQGYGEDNLGELGAFPHTKAAPQTDADFKSQLSNMGVSSKKKFAILASRFFSRRKRSKKPMSRQLLRDSSAPSTLNLLDDNDDEDDYDDRQSSPRFNDKPVIEPLPGNLASVPRTKTVQQSSFNTEPIVFYQDDDNFRDMV